MYEYSSVRSSSYDLEGLIASLNAKDSEGWEVVSVVPAGGELAAILRRSANASRSGEDSQGSTGGMSSGQSEVAPVESAPVQAAASPTPPEPAVFEPAYQAQEAPPVQEPSGWAAAVEPTSAPSSSSPPVSASPDPSPAPVAAPVASSAPPTQVQSAVPTTPAGWYPDPSGRFEMRYWDGNGWTEHVARGGQEFTVPPVA
ncbi:MAG: hypothetical protein JWL70_2489 [Acidimicrobiia bacterium]|nr:hypothetical protein [Acidimicrobiia bacterium]